MARVRRLAAMLKRYRTHDSYGNYGGRPLEGSKGQVRDSPAGEAFSDGLWYLRNLWLGLAAVAPKLIPQTT
jgi:hypothetical protein